MNWILNVSTESGAIDAGRAACCATALRVDGAMKRDALLPLSMPSAGGVASVAAVALSASSPPTGSPGCAGTFRIISGTGGRGANVTMRSSISAFDFPAARPRRSR